MPSSPVTVTVLVREVMLTYEIVTPGPAVDVHWMIDLWFGGRITASAKFLRFTLATCLYPRVRRFVVSFCMSPLLFLVLFLAQGRRLTELLISAIVAQTRKKLWEKGARKRLGRSIQDVRL